MNLINPNLKDARYGFTTYKNYLLGLSYLLDLVYSDYTIIVSKSKNVQPKSNIDEQKIRALLLNSWNSELLLNLPILFKDDFLKFSNHWAPVQSYYSIYLGFRALIVAKNINARGDHETTLRVIASNLIQSERLLPDPWGILLDEQGFQNSLGRAHDPILGPMAFTGILARLLRTAELARLQEIKQLGAGYLFHPYAFHTRFHHSLGVSWRVRFFIDSLPDKEFRNLSMKDKLALTIAGLLHDIGQSAWSHVGEQFAKFQGEYLSHEKRAADLILDDKGEFDTFFKPWVHLPRIREILPSRPLREKVAALIQGRPPISDVELPESQETTKENIRREKAWMAPLIRGPFDMDRADFLTRDAHFTLMATQMLIDPANMAQKVGIFRRDPPGISELVFLDCPFAESFITGRELMYHGVYLESRKLVADQVLIRAFHKLRNSLNSSVDSFWLSTDQRIFAYFEQSEDPFVALVRELMLCRKTFDIIYDVHFTELGPEERDNLIALDTRKERLLDAEEIIHQRCKAQGCSFDRDDFLLAIAPWSKPDIGKAWVKVGKELKRLDDVSPLLDALTSDRYIASRSKFIIAVNPIINMSDSDRNNLVRTARAFLSEDLNKLFLSTK